jgi:hypothetical protein
VNGTQARITARRRARSSLAAPLQVDASLADWPGLATARCTKCRDLRPTTDLRSILKGVRPRHLGAAESGIERRRWFPGQSRAGAAVWSVS